MFPVYFIKQRQISTSWFCFKLVNETLHLVYINIQQKVFNLLDTYFQYYIDSSFSWLKSRCCPGCIVNCIFSKFSGCCTAPLGIWTPSLNSCSCPPVWRDCKIFRCISSLRVRRWWISCSVNSWLYMFSAGSLSRARRSAAAWKVVRREKDWWKHILLLLGHNFLKNVINITICVESYIIQFCFTYCSRKMNMNVFSSIGIICSKKYWLSHLHNRWLRFGFMVFNATFNNISVILWRSVYWQSTQRKPAASHWQTLSHNVVSSTPRHE